MSFIFMLQIHAYYYMRVLSSFIQLFQPITVGTLTLFSWTTAENARQQVLQTLILMVEIPFLVQGDICGKSLLLLS